MLVNVGDVVMMTSALDLIAQNFPGLRLGVMARPEAAELLRGNPVVDDLIVYPYKSGSPFYGLGELLTKIRAGKYEAFLSLDRRPRGALAALLSGIGERVGPDILFAGARPKWWTRLLFTRKVGMSAEECRGSLAEMFQLAARRAFNISGKGRVTLPPVTAEQKQWVEQILGGAPKKPIVGLCVRTNDPGKTWPKNRFARLMTRLQRELGAFMYVTGGPGDVQYVDELLADLAPVPAISLAGRTSLMDILALAAASDLCITLDNGAAHLMAAGGQKNIICILIATKPKILVDSMPEATFMEFSSKGGWPEEGAEDDAARVFEAARKLIGNP